MKPEDKLYRIKTKGGIMKKVLILGYSNLTKEGVCLHLNKPAILKHGGQLATKEFWISWDKIGKSLFEDYDDRIDVAELNKTRKSYKEES